ncbi:hypothetical protein ACOME3_005533 [Neoechinorhynchus agilis]
MISSDTKLIGTSNGTSNNPFLDGLERASTKIKGLSHGLEESMRSNDRDRMDLQILRHTMGLGVALQARVELDLSSRIGRLPFTKRSLLHNRVLRGNLDEISEEDVLGSEPTPDLVNAPHIHLDRMDGYL